MLSKIVTITAGTPVEIEPASSTQEASEIIITPRAAATPGRIYVYCQGQIVTELVGATSATVPGLPFRIDRTMVGQKKLRLSDWTIDGAHSADTVIFAWEPC
jgi:hypothetical protein